MRCVTLVSTVSLGLVASFSSAATVAHYRFEGPAGTAAPGTTGAILDSSGNNFHGTAFNGPLYSSSVPFARLAAGGAANTTSLGFDGAGQRVFVPDNAAFRLTRSMTLEASVNLQPLRTGNGDGNIIFRGDDIAGYDPYRLTIVRDATSSSGYSARYQVSQTDIFVGLRTVQLNAPVPLGSWVSLQATLDDATGAMRLYVDGELKASTTTAVRPFAELNGNQSPGIGIGALQSANGNLGPEYLHGLIDEVRISDAALLPSQFLAAVPEPASLGAIMAAALTVGLRGRRSRKR